MKKSLMLLSASAVVLSACGNSKDNRPNVIVILADDLGYGDVSAQGSTTIHTPNFDRLANEGIRFTNGYATSATSTPSRYGLMTGMYPFKNKRAAILQGNASLIISEDQYTLPKLMQDAGYLTAAIGKWHLGMGDGNTDWNKTVKPGAREIGFDYSNLIAATNDRTPTVYVENGDVVGLDPADPLYVSYGKNFEGMPTGKTHPELLKMPWSHGHNQSIHNGISRIGYQKGGKSAMWVDEDMADYFTDIAKDFISEHKDKPFFMYFGLHQPHVPRVPHPRFVGSSGMGPRGDDIIEADWSVGEIIAHLEKLGLLENTLVFFSSDNGPVLNDGYKDQAVELLGDHKPGGPLRGGKYSLYEAGTRVPFFVYWKGKIKSAVSDALVCHIDILASVAELINQPLPGEFDSQNILPAFLGKSNKGRDELIIEAQQNRLALRKDNWVMIPPHKGRKISITGHELGNLDDYGLFNVVEDVGQNHNSAENHAKVLESLKTRFYEIVEGYYHPENARSW